MNDISFHIYTSGRPRIDDTEYEIVERKGVGHPDTLCDTIAEKISQAYSRYCLSHYGVILRHMVDKIALSGGSAEVRFGGGEMKERVRLYLNCRFTRTFKNEAIPYLEIVRDTVYEHFKEVLPLLDLDRWLEIVDNTHFAPGPGVVCELDGSSRNERKFFFDVPRQEFAVFHNNELRANDTSTAVAYSPLSTTERIVLFLERTLNGKSFKGLYPFVGTDIKVMARRMRRRVDLTVCVPLIAAHTPHREFYDEKIEFIAQTVERMVAERFEGYQFSVSLNTRDNPLKSDHYLTLTGSAIESGDEGVVGRGNRYNGVIPFMRHMSMEACCGKNPVYHIGKIYTVIGSQISEAIFNRLGVETYVYLTSQIGRNLSSPWSVYVEACGSAVDQAQCQIFKEIVAESLANASSTTQKLVRGEIDLC